MSRCRWRPIPGGIRAIRRSTLPFPKTEGERTAKGDPRRSIAERYPSKAAYLDQVRRATDGLIENGYLLPEDVERIPPTQRVAGIYFRRCQQPPPRNSSLLAIGGHNAVSAQKEPWSGQLGWRLPSRAALALSLRQLVG